MKKEQMTLNDYQSLAIFTRNKDINYNESLTCYALGASGEAGEVSDIIKKYVFHGHPMNKEHLMEEIGDTLWNLSVLAHIADVTLEDIAHYNINKLRERYPDGFDKDRSINRLKNKNTLK